MAFRRFYKRRPRRFRRRKVIRRRFRRFPMNRVPNTSRFYRHKLTCMIPVSFTGTTNLQAIGYSFPLNFPLMYRNIANTYGSVVTGSNVVPTTYDRFLGANTIFEQYKVNFLRIKFFPSEIETRNSSSAYDAADSPAILYRYNDPNDTIIMTGEVQALNMGLIPKTFYKSPVLYTYRQRKVNRRLYFDTQNYNIDVSTDRDAETAVNQETQGGMKLLFYVRTGVATGVSLGRLYIEWDCTFKGTRDIPGT